MTCSESSFLSHVIAVWKMDYQGPRVETRKGNEVSPHTAPPPPLTTCPSPRVLSSICLEAFLQFSHSLCKLFVRNQEPQSLIMKPERFSRNCLQNSSQEDTEWPSPTSALLLTLRVIPGVRSPLWASVSTSENHAWDRSFLVKTTHPNILLVQEDLGVDRRVPPELPSSLPPLTLAHPPFPQIAPAASAPHSGQRGLAPPWAPPPTNLSQPTHVHIYLVPQVRERERGS